MPVYQYRLVGKFDWVSGVGNAVVALENLASSGKKITIRSLELDVQRYRPAGSGGERLHVGLVTGTGTDGSVINVNPSDTSLPLPSGIVVRSQGSFTTVSTIARSSAVGGGFDPNAVLSTLCTPGALGGGLRCNWLVGRKRGTSPTTPLIVQPGQDIAITVSGETAGNPSLMVSMSFSANSGMYSAVTFANPGANGEALIWLRNGSVGTVQILDWCVSILGSHAVSPYLQVVPYAGVPLETVDTLKSPISLSKMDSADPNPSSWVRVFSDTPLTPAGAPIQYASDVGAGAPKGFNYLGTKDFLGPVFRSIFPEGAKYHSGTPDGWGLDWSQKFCDVAIRRGSGLVLRPGEGLAIVPAAETIGTAAAATSAMHPVYVNIALDIDNLVQPFLVLNGVQPGSDVVVLQPGTDVLIDSADSIGGSTYSLAYDPDLISSVDVCVYRTGYVPFTVRNLNLGAFGATVPVAQIQDRAYSNP